MLLLGNTNHPAIEHISVVEVVDAVAFVLVERRSDPAFELFHRKLRELELWFDSAFVSVVPFKDDSVRQLLDDPSRQIMPSFATDVVVDEVCFALVVVLIINLPAACSDRNRGQTTAFALPRFEVVLRYLTAHSPCDKDIRLSVIKHACIPPSDLYRAD